MSHFTVLVIGPDPDRQLAPFQENNMGDCPPEFMEFQDMTEEINETWEGDCFTEWDPEFVLHDVVLDDADLVSFKMGRKTTIKEDTTTVSKANVGCKGKLFIRGFGIEFVHMLSMDEKGPDGVEIVVERVEAPMPVTAESLYGTKDVLAEDYFHYTRNASTGAWGYWTNPNSKWDWYSLGGRWRGYFRVKPIEKLSRICDACGEKISGDRLLTLDAHDCTGSCKCPECGEAIAPLPIVGSSEIFGRASVETKGRADACLLRDVDFEAMESEAMERANELYDELEDAVKGIEEIPQPWSVFLARSDDENDELTLEDARKLYGDQPWVKAVRKNSKLRTFMECMVDEYCVHSGGRDAFVERARRNCVVSFAVLKDGEWIESGQMGWFGFASNQKDESEWQEMFYNSLKDLPADTPLAVYDCHV